MNIGHVYKYNHDIKVDDMHSFVEATLEEFNPIIAKSYRDYRNYKKDFVHMMDKVYERLIIIYLLLEL